MKTNNDWHLEHRVCVCVCVYIYIYIYMNNIGILYNIDLL